MTIAQLDGLQLAYERSGTGEPLLLIMGMSGTALHWGEAFLGPLRGQFDVIAYDHRGVGESTRLHGAVTIPQMAGDAAALLDHLQLDSAHVLGISMGGMIAQELALARPELIRSLAIGCSYCGGQGSALTGGVTIAKLTEAMMSGDRARALRAGWEANVAPPAVADEQLYKEFLDVSARRSVAVPVVMEQMQACAAHDTRERLGEIDARTLVIHGTADLMLPVQNGRLIASLIDGSRLEILDGTGHLFFWERPDESAELIRAHALA